jgi:hypothetical protein
MADSALKFLAPWLTALKTFTNDGDSAKKDKKAIFKSEPSKF